MKTVFLHGLGQCPHDWDEVINQVPFLDTDCPALFSLGKAVTLTYPRILTGLEARYASAAEPFRLCGLSLGAVLALDYTIRHPDQVSSLIWIAGQLRSPKLLVDIQNLLFRCMSDKMFQDMSLSKEDAIRLTRSMRGLDLLPGLARVTCPVMVLCGDRDRANQTAARKLATLLPQAQLHLIPAAGHELNHDAPAAIAKFILFDQTQSRADIGQV